MIKTVLIVLLILFLVYDLGRFVSFFPHYRKIKRRFKNCDFYEVDGNFITNYDFGEKRSFILERNDMSVWVGHGWIIGVLPFNILPFTGWMRKDLIINMQKIMQDSKRVKVFANDQKRKEIKKEIFEIIKFLKEKEEK